MRFSGIPIGVDESAIAARAPDVGVALTGALAV